LLSPLRWELPAVGSPVHPSPSAWQRLAREAGIKPE